MIQNTLNKTIVTSKIYFSDLNSTSFI